MESKKNVRIFSTLHIVLPILLLKNFCVITASEEVSTSRDISYWSSFIPREAKVLLDSCMGRSNAGYCLQKRMIDVLNRALMKDSIVIADGLSIDKTKDATNITEPMARQHSGPITEIVWDKLEKFFNTRVISINLGEEGRGKKKKKELAYYAVAVATAMALLIPLTLKGIAFLAGSALLIAKVALVLAGLAALKHFVHHPGGEDSHRRVHIEDLTDAHNLAYGGYTTSHHVA